MVPNSNVSKRDLLSTLNTDCLSVLAPLLTLHEFVNVFGVLNKNFNQFATDDKSQFNQYFWKNKFKNEFLHEPKEFPDIEI